MVIEPNYPTRKSRQSHADYIYKQFEKAWEQAQKENDARRAVSALSRDGIYLEIKGKAGYELITKSLEYGPGGIRLANIKTDENDVVAATVYVPNNKKDFFIKKINKYHENETGMDVIGTIESINDAMVEALWVGKKEAIPDITDAWCEIWLRYEKNDEIENVISDFNKICKQEQIECKDQKIVFPERIVVGVKANREKLTMLLMSSSKLAEMRKMITPTSFFDEMKSFEQREWMTELKERIDVSKMSNTSVCILDTGINNGHPLLADVLKDSDVQAVDSRMMEYDDDGHGTKMAGIATYFNLQDKIESMEPFEVNHFLESVKIKDNVIIFAENLYGDITSRAVNLAEVENPYTNRTICMAITSDSDCIKKDGRPSSWSGAIDNIVAGVGEEGNKRIMCISAGNTYVEEIIKSGNIETAVINHSVDDPGQAWNAITIGAFTEKDVISDPYYKDYTPVVEHGGYSPFTSSSVNWSSKWPVKPEIVLEGGNLGYDSKSDFYTEAPDLSILTTSKDFNMKKAFDVFSMTSCATAQASYISANICNEYPKLWPETIRALIIHSAEWTDKMKEMIFDKSLSKGANYRNLLRICGYGVPNLERAIRCAENSVNIIIQDELQPFRRNGNDNPVFNEMHIHELPWPSDLLMELENTNVRMKITLSYYIEPGPGEIGWKDKYRYESCGLLFDVNNIGEDEDEFKKRISQAIMDEAEDKSTVKNKSERWLLGTNNRNSGSIHSDVWEGTASDLSQSNLIMVYPITGWWKTRTNLKRYNSKIRYSLIITIETPEVETKLYTKIQTQIKNKAMVMTKITTV